jgi:hypothetical protein
MQLRIKLRDGFHDARVRVSLGGREVFDKRGVTTDLATSLAEIIELSTDEQRATLEVAIEGGASHRQPIAVADTPFVDVSVQDGAMKFLASADDIPIL